MAPQPDRRAEINGLLGDADFDGDVDGDDLISVQTNFLEEGPSPLLGDADGDGDVDGDDLIAVQTNFQATTPQSLSEGATEANALVPVPGFGDMNGDGLVDAPDYTIWRDSYEQGGFDLLGDADLDGDVDLDDYAEWAANYGSFAGSTGLSIPEPTATALLLGGLAASIRRLR